MLLASASREFYSVLLKVGPEECTNPSHIFCSIDVIHKNLECTHKDIANEE